jgi:hypothetical protein
MNTSRSNKQQRGRRPRRAQVNSGSRPTTMVIPRQFGFAAPRLRVTLLFQKQFIMNNSGYFYGNTRFSPTDAYDVDPALSSTAMAGFAQYAAMYRFYRTHASTIKADFVNQESFGLLVYVCPSNADPGNNWSSAQSYLSNPRSKQIPLGPATGASSGSIRAHLTTSQAGGVSSQSILDEYSALTGSSPNNNWWWVVGTHGASNLSSGIFVSVRIEIEVEFFEYANPVI